MSRPIRWSIAAAVVAGAVFGGGVALGQAPEPSASGPIGGPVGSAAPSMVPTSGSPAPILGEDFTSPSDEWWTGTDEGESTSFYLGSLRTVLSEGPRRTWQWMELPEPLEAVDVEGEVTLDEGGGAGGVTCGPAGETGDWIWGGYNSDGEWLLGRLVDGHIKVDARGELPLVRDPDAPVGGALPVALRLDCTRDRDGSGGHAVLWTKGIQVADVPVSGIGPFGKAGFLAAIDDGPLTILFDDLVVRDRSSVADPSPSSLAPVRIALSGAGPLGIDITEGIAWVVGSDSGDVEGVDLAAGSSSQLIPVGSLPTHVVAVEGGVAVSRIDASGILGPLVLIRPGWQEIASVATDALGGIAEGEPGTVWALTKAGEVLLVDTATREIIDRVAVAVDDAEHMEPVSGAGSLWVASDSLPVQRVTGPDLAVSATIETGGGIPLAYADGLIWGARPDMVWAIDPSVDQVTQTVPLEGLTEILAMDVADGEAWIAARRAGRVGTVLQVDLATGDVLAEYPVSLPAGVRVADDRAWVTSYDTNELIGFPR